MLLIRKIVRERVRKKNDGVKWGSLGDRCGKRGAVGAEADDVETRSETGAKVSMGSSLRAQPHKLV